MSASPLVATVRLFAAATLLFATAGCGSDPSGPITGDPVEFSQVVVIAGDFQAGTVGAPLDTMVRVIARDDSGEPVSGARLLFAASGNGTATPAEVVTGVDGTALVQWALDTRAGDNLLSVLGDGATLAVLSATGFADLPAQMTLLSGNDQTGLTGTALAAPIVISITDQYDNPVAGVPVVLTISTGSGAVAPTQPISDLEGFATATWTLGAVGQQAATARIPDTVATGVIGSPLSLAATATTLTLAATPTVVTAGNIVTLDGTGFSADTSGNVVTIDGIRATVVHATPTAIGVAIPSFGCVTARARTVQVSRGTQSASTTVTVRPGNLLRLQVGESAVLTDPEYLCLQLDGSGSSGSASEYLIGLTATSALHATAAYSIVASNSGAGEAASPQLLALGPATVTNHVGIRNAEQGVRDWERRFLAGNAARVAQGSRGTRATSPLLLKLQPGSNIAVRLPNIGGDLCNSYTSHEATVLHSGATLVVAAVGIPGAAGDAIVAYPEFVASLASIEATAATIRDRLHAYIGALPASLDADGKLTILLTPAGIADVPTIFGSVVDLLPVTTCPASNEQAIIYTSVAVDYSQPAQAVAAISTALVTELPGLVHQSAYLFRHAARIEAGVGTPLPAWLAEGQSELMVEAVGHALRGVQPGMNHGPDPVFSDPIGLTWYRPRFDGLAAYFGWDGATGKVTGAPAECSLFGFGGACHPDAASGAAWSFVRYLTDRIAGATPDGEAELHRLLALLSSGESINTFLLARAGASMEDLIVDWAMMLYTDGRLASAVAGNLEMTSWNLATIFDQLPTERRLVPRDVDISGFAASGSVMGGGSAYLRLAAPAAHGPLAIRAMDVLGRSLSDELAPRFWLVRTR